MKAFRPGRTELFDAFIKSAQYIVRLKTQQDLWDHLGKLVIAYFPAEWTAFVRREPGDRFSIHHCTLAEEVAPQRLLTEEVRALVADVLDSSFLASRVLFTPAPSMTAFLPIVEGPQPGTAMLIGHQAADPLPRELLNIYLAMAGLAGTTFERLQHERELLGHRAHLQELVKERTAELERAKRQNELLLRSVGEGICGVDLEGSVTFANPSAARMVGWDPDDLIGRNAHAAFHHTRADGSPYPAEECLLHSALGNGKEICAADELFWRQDGTRFPVEFTTAPIVEEGNAVGAVLVFRDITERRLAEAERERLLERLEAQSELLQAQNEELQAQAEELQAQNAELQAQEAELERLVASEQKAKSLAEEAVKIRDEFISIAAHELRTPVASLQGFAQLTQRELRRTGSVDPERLSGAMERIEHQSRRLTMLTNHLLNLSRLQSGKLILSREETNLSLLLRRAIADLQYSHAGRVIELSEGTLDVALVDPLRLEQVLTNLVDNAIKFSPEDSTIEVEVDDSDPGWVEIAVRDHGIGIPAGEEERIFERFHQAHPDRRAGGMGIGLFVSRQIAEMHGGTLTAERPQDGGSRFALRLPVVRPGVAIPLKERTAALPS